MNVNFILNNTNLIVEILAGVLSVIVAIKLKTIQHTLFASLLLLIAFLEIMAKFSSAFNTLNIHVVNVFRNSIMYYEIIVMFIIYQLLLKHPINKKINSWLLLVSIIWMIIMNVTIQPITSFFPTYSYIPTSLLLTISIFLFLKERLSFKENQNQNNRFWFFVSIGFLLGNLTQIPTMGILNYLLENENSPLMQHLETIYFAKLFLSTLFYLFFIRAFYEYYRN